MRLILILILLNLIAGCTSADDDSQNVSVTDVAAPSVTNWDVYYIETAEDLPECVQETLGRLYYVAAQDSFQVCTSTGWMEIELRGSDGADGSAGSAGFDGSSCRVEVRDCVATLSCDDGSSASWGGRA